MMKVMWTAAAAAGLTAMAMMVSRGIEARTHAAAVLAEETRDSAIPTVAVIRPAPGAPSDELVLPGNIEAFTDTPVYARTSGYLKKWYVDIGTRVDAGELLAEIETPEIDQQLKQARAELETVRANYRLAQSTAERFQFLLKSESVSRQDTEEKVGDLAAKKAAVDAAAANVDRLQDLQSFQKIYAPFDGVITARNIDVGALINAGSNGTGKELFHIAATGRMRVYVQVPEVNSPAARPGTPVELTLAELPGRRFRAKVVRTSGSIDPVSRTLLAEVDVDNPSGALLPGAYVEVHLKLRAAGHSLVVPVNAVLFRTEGLTVAAVRGGHVALLPITVGHDYGNTLEVVSGLEPGEELIVNPPDSIEAGQEVRVRGQQ
jgi:RND family efflux transporter MFP subunit